MPHHSTPVVDEKNPLYCPDVPATAYLDTLRRLRARRLQGQDPLRRRTTRSFPQLLDAAIHSEIVLGRQRSDTCDSVPTPEAHSIGARTSGHRTPPWEYHPGSGSSPESPCFGASIRRASGPKLQRLRLEDHSFSDFGGSSKFEKSIQSVHNSSFEVSVRREKLHFSTCVNEDETLSVVDPFDLKLDRDEDERSALLWRVQFLQDELYGPPVGSETPTGMKRLVSCLDSILPGIRLQERILALPKLNHQTIATYLGQCGHLNERVLSILRTSEIRELSLTSSLVDELGLNVAGHTLLSVFSKPNSFLFLSSLDLAGTPLDNDCIVQIHHLPRLARLTLDDTGIGNEAIYHLVSLKRTLTYLSITHNPKITDEAVYALGLLLKLDYISIYETGISIEGLRHFARTMSSQNRIIDMRLPTTCEDYLDHLTSEYLVKPTPPLVTEPDACSKLSAAALKRNLLAHAQCNPNINSYGTRAELADRLYRLLKRRQDDLLIQERCY